MSAHITSVPKAPVKLEVSSRIKSIYTVSIFIGVLSLGLALKLNADRAWHSFLTSAFYFLNLALGGLFFTAIQYVTKAGWSVNVRRVAEAFTAYLPIGFVTFLLILLGMSSLYPWVDPKVLATEEIIKAKEAYLNTPFFMIRLVVFMSLWLGFKKYIVGNSVGQDEDGSVQRTVKNVGISVAFLLVFALSYSLFSVDSIMSLEPRWFSTIFGVYCFAGLFQSFLAAFCLLLIYLIHQGSLRGFVNENHLHDIGKFLKGFTIFYAYIAFSQFMLIWYANLPEETFFYLDRTNAAWMGVTVSLFVLKFAVPFLMLLPKWAKRSPAQLSLVSVLILVMQYVDIHWLVYPNLKKEEWLFGWPELGIFIGMAGLFMWSVFHFLSRHSVLAYRDPRLMESMEHHVTY